MALVRPRWGLARRGARDPFEEMFDRMVERFFGEWPGPRLTGPARGWTPAVDMIDRPDAIVLRADLPGLEQKDVEVRVDDGTLTIRGERREEQEAREEDFYCAERWTGSFERTISLPAGVDPDRIQATFRNGVLEVHIPKTQQAQAKKIEVKAA